MFQQSAPETLNTSSKSKYKMLDVWKVPVEATYFPNEDRKKLVDSMCLYAGPEGFEFKSSSKVCDMSFIEEMSCVLLMLFGVPGGPVICLAITVLAFWTKTSLGVLALLSFILLSIVPAAFYPSIFQSWLVRALLKYFSLRGIWQQDLDPTRHYILVAPPHGVFPFGNILTMLAMPRLGGFAFKGLGASAALHLPIFRQLLCGIGTIDADKETAKHALDDGHTIGISTGGIAEIFQTNNVTETIIMKDRKGMVKLAFRTGSPLVPCFLMGNSQCLSLWYDSFGIMELISRMSRVSFILFWGRWLLPIPRRIPIAGVMGLPIEVEKKDEPTAKEIDDVHEELLRRMKVLFDEHKKSYGWQDKELVIK